MSEVVIKYWWGWCEIMCNFNWWISEWEREVKIRVIIWYFWKDFLDIWYFSESVRKNKIDFEKSKEGWPKEYGLRVLGWKSKIIG